MSKADLRRRVWNLLIEKGVSRFPGAVGRIPNFVGAEGAARLLSTLPSWERVQICKCNPDAPQGPVRYLALASGKTVFMAVPRLRTERCFLELDAKGIQGSLRQAASIRGASREGRPVRVTEVVPLDLILCGSVAVNRAGARVGKGGGYSDIEFALLIASGKVSPATLIVTTVHPLQIVSEEIEMQVHDIPVDLIITPEEVVETRTRYPRPWGICWDLLPAEKIAAIPVLDRLRRDRSSGISEGGGWTAP
ncbi:MAG: 5-formyltetrahydrofolate cyclo-ligase [Candidatus Methylomirabilales bacterium]